MNTLAKLIAAIAALVASLALAWIAKEGVTVTHKGTGPSPAYAIPVWHFGS